MNTQAASRDLFSPPFWGGAGGGAFVVARASTASPSPYPSLRSEAFGPNSLRELSPKGRGVGAFTLIELLVVVTIIVMLLALLAPAMEKAIDAAEKAVCMSNQKTLGFANQMYANEARQWFVPVKTPNMAGGAPTHTWAYGDTEPWWFNPLYQKMLGVGGLAATGGTPAKTYTLLQSKSLTCPGAPADMRSQGQVWLNYGFNMTGFIWQEQVSTSRRLIDRMGKSHASVLQMTDVNNWHILKARSNHSQFWDLEGDSTAGTTPRVTYRHQEGANAAHFDGHVEWYRKQDMSLDNELWDLFRNGEAPVDKATLLGHTPP